MLQFVLLGSLSVTLNTCADLVVASLAGPIGRALARRPGLQNGQRLSDGVGAYWGWELMWLYLTIEAFSFVSFCAFGDVWF